MSSSQGLLAFSLRRAQTGVFICLVNVICFSLKLQYCLIMLMGSKSCFLTEFRNAFYGLSKFDDIICYYTDYHSKLIRISNNSILNKHGPSSIAKMLLFKLIGFLVEKIWIGNQIQYTFLSLQEVVCM